MQKACSHPALRTLEPQLDVRMKPEYWKPELRQPKRDPGNPVGRMRPSRGPILVIRHSGFVIRHSIFGFPFRAPERSKGGAPTVCRHVISGSISLPEQGFFSPFPHGTGSLSVTDEYLALEGGPPGFRRSFTCSALLGIPVGRLQFSCTGLSPAMAQLSRSFH